MNTRYLQRDRRRKLKRKVFVSGMPFKAKAAEFLIEFFQKHNGVAAPARVAALEKGGRKTGQAYATFETTEAADAAVALSGSKLEPAAAGSRDEVARSRRRRTRRPAAAATRRQRLEILVEQRRRRRRRRTPPPATVVFVPPRRAAFVPHPLGISRPPPVPTDGRPSPSSSSPQC